MKNAATVLRISKGTKQKPNVQEMKIKAKQEKKKTDFKTNIEQYGDAS